MSEKKEQKDRKCLLCLKVLKTITATQLKDHARKECGGNGG